MSTLEAQSKTTKEQRDFGAERSLSIASSVVRSARGTDALRKARILFGNAGLQAAQEARWGGTRINGWTGRVETNVEPPAAEDNKYGEELWFIDVPLSWVGHVDRLPDNLRHIARLATNPYLKYDAEEVA